MITRIINAIKKNSHISAYAITETKTESCDLYYVKKELQTNRAGNYTEWEVSIYVDKDGLRGNSSFIVDPYFDDLLLEEKVNEAANNALLALNKYFDLPSKSDDVISKNESNLDGKNFNDLMSLIVPAVFRADCFENGSLNATEIFLYRYDYHLVNSNGVDVKFSKFKGNIELIPSFVDGDNKFEVYKMLSFASLDTKKITSDIEEAMRCGFDRSKATKLELKDNNINVLIPAGELSSFFGYFKYMLDYQAQFFKMSPYQIGSDMQKDAQGDRITLNLKPMIASSADSTPVDASGVVLSEINIVKDGIATNYHGAYRVGKQLGIDKPTGVIPNMVISAGSADINQVKKDPYLECVRFSGIQMDPFTGFFGGEVRLGYYFDGDKKIPVTGFCISGNINDIKTNMYLSNDIVGDGRYEGPSYLITKEFKIN